MEHSDINLIFTDMKDRHLSILMSTIFQKRQVHQVKVLQNQLEINLNSMLVPFEIPSIAKTTLVDVFPYLADEVPANLTPINEVAEEEEDELTKP